MCSCCQPLTQYIVINNKIQCFINIQHIKFRSAQNISNSLYRQTQFALICLQWTSIQWPVILFLKIIISICVVSAGYKQRSYSVLVFIMAIMGVQGCSSSESCITPAPAVLSKDYCYSAQIRSSVLQGLPFGGVPTVLVLNFMCFLVSPLITRQELLQCGKDYTFYWIVKM